MGAKQSTAAVPTRTDHTEVKKKESSSLQKSRAKYLSQALGASEPNLTAIGQGGDNGDITAEQNNVAAAAGITENSEAEQKNSMGKVVIDIELELIENKDTSFGEVIEQELSSAQVPLLETEKPKRGTKEIGTAAPITKGRPSFQPLGRYDRSASFHDEVDHKAARVLPEDYRFLFENLVFEGGGNKGLAYCGAVRYLEELGVMDNVKCFAGASAGGMVAGLMAVGYSSYEIEEFLSDRIDRIFLDATCGYCSLLPNLLQSFGWNPGRRIYKWFGDKLKEKTGNADVTFHELHQKHGKIVCIIVTNLNQMTTEYCHPKTTPSMPIRTALRMSMAIPGLFSAMKYGQPGQEDIYVDGGVLCWYLSMSSEDSFIRRLQPLRDIPIIMERTNRFGSYNDKTLGMLLYSDTEEDILRINLERRVGCLNPAKPKTDTKLFIERQKEAKVKLRAEREHAKVVQAVDSFLRVLKKYNIDKNHVIDRGELEAAFKDENEFPRHQAEVLFGKDFAVSEVFDLLDDDDNGLIRYDELVRFIEGNGVSLQNRFLGYQRKEIKNFSSFLGVLQSTIIFNVKKLYVEERDLDRTVGINTGHVSTTDFVLEEADREFVVQRGYNSMRAFLQYYVVRHPDKVHKKRAEIPVIPETSVLSSEQQQGSGQ